MNSGLDVPSVPTLDMFPANVALLDSDGGIVEVNARWSAFASNNGLDDPEGRACVGENYLAVCESAGSFGEVVADGIREVLAGSTESFKHFYSCHAPDEKRWFRLEVTPMKVHGVTGAIAAHWNVTDKELAEKVHSDLAAIVQSSSDAIIGKDLDGTITVWNESAEKIFGYTAEEIVGQSITRIIPPTHIAEELAIITRIRAGIPVPLLETLRIRKDGTPVDVSISISPIRDAANTVVGASKIVRDVTVERRALHALQDSEYRHRKIVESSNDGIWSFDKEGRVDFANQRLLDMLGYAEDELIGRPFTDFIAGDAGPYAKKFEQAQPGDGEQLEICYKRKDGSPLHALIAVTAFTDEHGGALAMVTDIGALKDAEREVSQAAVRLQEMVDALRDIATLGGSSAELLELAAAKCQAMCCGDGAVIGTIEGEYIVWQSASGMGERGRGRRLHRDRSISGLVAHEGRALICDDTETDSRSDQSLARLMGMRSTVVTPLRADNEVIGVIAVMSERPHAFHTADMANLELMSESIGALLQRRVTAEAVRASEEDYRMLFRNNPTPMWVFEPPTLRFLAVNSAAIRHYGWSEAEFLSMTIRDIRPVEDREAPFLRGDFAGPATNEPLRHQTHDGRIIWVEIHADDIVFAGVPARLIAADDITARVEAEREVSRVNRALRLLGRCHEAIAHAETEQALLQPVCDAAVEIGGYRMAWIGAAIHDDARRIKPLAHAGHEDGYLTEVHLTWSDTDANRDGPVGRSIRTGIPVIADDIECDGSSLHCSNSALSRGYRGVICLPLRNGSHAFGVFCLYSGEVRHMSADESALLEELADALSFGLTGLRAQEERSRLEQAVLTVATGVSAATGNDFFERLVKSMAVAVAAPIAAISRLLPGEPTMARTIAVAVDGEIIPNFDYAIHGTPCDYFAHSESATVTSGLADSYPAFWATALGGTTFIGSRLDNARGETIGLASVVFHDGLPESGVIVSTLRIFAARAAAEVERQESDARIREQASLLDRARDAILVCDLDGTVTNWNKSAERIYGWTCEEALGRTIRTLIYSDPSRSLEALEETLRRGEWAGDLAQVSRAGDKLTVEARWTLLRDENGEPSRILSIATDVTERKKLEQQFLRAQRMDSLGTLAGGIAHDLNNVLTPILLSVDLLRTEVHDPGALELLDTVADSARRGAEMVRQVLSFARGVEGQRVAVAIPRVLGDIGKIARDTFPKSTQVRLTVPTDLWTVLGDATQLHQVVLNLCVNARDAIPDGGEIRISAANFNVDSHYAGMNSDATEGPHVVITVQDTGMGIPASNLDRIFDPFFTTKETGQGTGLGLSTSLAIVKSHGGFFRAYSELGRGSRFQAFLPAQPFVSGPAEAALPTSELPRGNGELVLVVDDEPMIRQITTQTLEAFGYRVIGAGDGAEGIALYAQNIKGIDVVLTDMMMPVMDGRAMIAALVRINPAVRIIAASGGISNDRATLAERSAVLHYLSKPYTAEELLMVLRDALVGA